LKLANPELLAVALITGITLVGKAAPASVAPEIRGFSARDAAAWEDRLCSTNRTTRRQAYEELRAGGVSALPVLGRLLGADREVIRHQALDLTGRVRWRFNGNPASAVYRPSSDIPGVITGNSIIASPAFHDGRGYLARGQDPTHGDGMGRLYAIAADGSGDVTRSGRVWEYTGLHLTICTQIVQDGLVYVGDNYGVVHCVDPETGKRVWAHDQKGRIWGCMLLAGNCLYVGDEDGRLVVYRAGRKLDILEKNGRGGAI
jgi:outer membrane protein assembly factor BamB